MVLSADRPRETLAQDRLGYAPFARAIAKAIRSTRSPDGLVFAIHGPWGSGKTSAVNMVVEALRDPIDTAPSAEPPVVVRFNPWWFSEQQDLTRVFFAEVSAALGDQVPKEVVDRLKSVARHVVRGKDVVLGLLDFIPGGSLGKLPLGGFLDAIGQGLDDQHSLDEERTALAEALRAHDRRILIIIDDIDRLPADEARQMFRLVKSVADLPNVLYLLVFDRRIAAEALRTEADTGGPHWLEKIVQASFDLPPVDRLDLRQLFLGRMEETLGQVDVPDQGRWITLYLEAVEPWLRTPRDVTRLCNALSVSFPPVAGEVDFADFVALETLRLFEPELHGVVRHSAEDLTGLRSELRQAHDSVIGERLLAVVPADRHARVKKALEHLFPRLESIWGNRRYSGDFMRQWSRQRRCCVPGHFPAYFTFSIGDDTLSRQELSDALEALQAPDTARDLVARYARDIRRSGETRAALLLEEVRTEAPDLSEAHAAAVLMGFLHAADLFLTPQDEGKGVFPLPAILWVSATVDALIDRLPKDRRAQVLEDALRETPSLSALSFSIVSLAREHGRHTDDAAKPEDQRRLTEDDVLRLETLLAERLRAAAADGSLLALPDALRVLYKWVSLAGEETVKAWTARLLDDDEATVRLAQVVTTTSRVQSGNDPRVHARPHVDRKGLSPILDVDRLVERVHALDPGADDAMRAIIGRFLEGLERTDRGDF